ncbi:hypothetical protein F0U61_39740 [Archangium violaceum]|uniref:hypothetical protein n=1 Tax=Archangium violaceum TaxID=83451 RepID=UPI002B2BF589|nr:hypothetical protein F0U61_39740 [Archangium violaceum]
MSIDPERARILTSILDRSMVHAVPDAKVRDELSFHIADVLRGFLRIQSLLEKAFDGGELSRVDVEEVVSLMASHWPYHLKAIARLRKRLDGEFQ